MGRVDGHEQVRSGCVRVSGAGLAREVIAKVGVWWPAGDEDRLRAAAGLWRVFAANVDLLAEDASRAAGDLVGANSGAAVDAFDAFWARYDGGPDAYLPALAEAARAMGTALERYADTVHRAKVRLEEMAATGAATIVVEAGLAVFTFGASEAVAAEVAGGLVTAAAALGVEVSAEAAEIVAAVLGDAAVAAAENTVLDIVVAQPVRVLGFHDGAFSLDEVEQALSSGAAQGAAGSLGRVLRHQPEAPGIVAGQPRPASPGLPAEPPAWSPPGVREHWMWGELRPNESQGGYHVRHGGVDVGPAQIDSSTVKGLGNGVYGAKWGWRRPDGTFVQKKDGSGPRSKYSTFFPDAWTHARVEEAIGEVFEDFIGTYGPKPLRGSFVGVVDGVKIRVVFKLDSATHRYDLVTAYPTDPQ